MEDLQYFLKHVGTDPSRLIFEDELTGLYNRRFLLNYFEHKVDWDSLEAEPVSLLMLDVDRFKQINDTHGHDVGDQALIWVAKMMKEAAGEDGMSVRYAGDEFMILVPGAAKEKALKIGKGLIEISHEKPWQKDIDVELTITLSVGAASAPDDAQTGKELIHKADTALYYAKESGRDCLAESGDIPPQEVFSKTTLHQLEKGTISGRESQYKQVSKALQDFNQGENQLLIIEGVDGMGKSEFLKTIRLNLADSDILQIEVKGNLQENFRPYYMTTNILVGIMNELPDNGEEILNDLTPQETTYLSYILPQLGKAKDSSEEGEEKISRDELFSTLVHFIPQLLDSSPLMLLIDDMNFCDEASLLLLRQILLRDDVPLLVCGTSSHLQPGELRREPAPLESFFAQHHQELNMVRVMLTPLTATDIAKHFQRIFPQVHLPKNFDMRLAQLTQGNPLFISEILRKLVSDRKITLTGEQWVIERVEDDYLPNSLEEIVGEKVAVLDEESRRLLDQASTFGENVSLSMLTGSSEIEESKVLEFIDQAVTQGLISSEYQSNDENIRFLSKRILNLTYGAIQEDRKQELHERIGAYQETLYDQQLLPSAAPLAYHYQLSANEEKADQYRKLTETNDEKLFDAEEAADYTGDELSGGTLSTKKLRILDSLDRSAVDQVPEIIQALLRAVGEMELDPPDSQAILSATRKLKDAIDKVLEASADLHLTLAKQSLLVNGQRMDAEEHKSAAEAFAKRMNHIQLRGVAFFQGLTEQELTLMLEAIVQMSGKSIDRGFWKRLAKKQDLSHIEFKQMSHSYVASSGPEEASTGAGGLGLGGMTPGAVGPGGIGPGSIGPAGMGPEGIGTEGTGPEGTGPAGMGAKSGDPGSTGPGSLGSGSLGRPGRGSMGSEGAAPMSSGQAPQQGGLAAAPEQPGGSTAAADPTSDLQGPAELGREPSSQNGPEPGGARHTDVANLRIAADGVELTDDFLESAEEKLSNLFLKGDEEEARQIINQFFQGFLHRSDEIRTKVVQICDRLLNDPSLASQPQLVELLTDPLSGALMEEENLGLLGEMGALLSRTAGNHIQFGDYRRAARVLTYLRKCQEQLQTKGLQEAGAKELIFFQELDPKARQLLMEDLKSQESTRMQEATQLLDGLGPLAFSMLIEVIKKEDDPRIRQIACHLLSERGEETAELLKRELVLEGFAQQRVRILEVIDTITKDLRKELAYVLEDESSRVRRAGFLLLERLNDERLAPLLVDYANHRDSTIAIAAIKSLGKIKPAGAAGVLVSLLDSAKETDRVVAACRALGQIADPSSVEPLATVIAPIGFFSFQKPKDPLVRATAAFALAQIPDARVTNILRNHLKDSDWRIRQTAHEIVNGQNPSFPG
jgi:diguanylate cyclase (GGDEF)-like protein